MDIDEDYDFQEEDASTSDSGDEYSDADSLYDDRRSQTDGDHPPSDHPPRNDSPPEKRLWSPQNSNFRMALRGYQKKRLLTCTTAAGTS